MRGISLGSLTIAVCALTGLTGSTSALAITPGVHAFEAHLQDAPCGKNTFCGSGKLTGFGTVKTRLAVRRFVAPPAAGCLGVVGTRRLTLASDRKNALRLAVKGSLRIAQLGDLQGFLRKRSLRGRHGKWRHPRQLDQD